MFSGRKSSARVAVADEIGASRLWLALILVTALTGALWWSIESAPEVVAVFD